MRVHCTITAGGDSLKGNEKAEQPKQPKKDTKKSK